MGIFIEKDELAARGMDGQLEEFFNYLRDLDKIILISADYIIEMERRSELNNGAHAAAKNPGEHPV